MAKNILQAQLNKNFAEKEEFIDAVTRYSEYYNRSIVLTSITPEVAEKIFMLISYWNALDAEKETASEIRVPIKIFINSQGGDLQSTLTIVDAIKISRTPVFTYNIGTCYREALYIYLMGLKRYSLPRASFLFEKKLDVFTEENQASNYDKFIEKQNKELKHYFQIINKSKLNGKYISKYHLDI